MSNKHEDFSRKEMADIIHHSAAMCKDYHYLVSIGTVAAGISLLASMIFWPYRLFSLFPERFDFFYMFSFSYMAGIFSTNFSLGVILASILVIGVLIYFFFPVWANAAVISSVHNLKRDPNLKLGFWRSMWIGLGRVFVLYEYEALTIVFDVSQLGTVIYLLMRVFEPGPITNLWGVFLGIAIFQLFFSILLVYAKYRVVIMKGQIFKSMHKSMTLVAFYLSETFLLLLIVGFFVGLVFLYTILYFAFPAIIIFILQFLLQRFSEMIAWYIGGAIAIFMFVIFAKLIGYARVFLTTLWTLTYLELSQRKEHRLIEEIAEEND